MANCQSSLVGQHLYCPSICFNRTKTFLYCKVYEIIRYEEFHLVGQSSTHFFLSYLTFEQLANSSNFSFFYMIQSKKQTLSRIFAIPSLITVIPSLIIKFNIWAQQWMWINCPRKMGSSLLSLIKRYPIMRSLVEQLSTVIVIVNVKNTWKKRCEIMSNF